MGDLPGTHSASAVPSEAQYGRVCGFEFESGPAYECRLRRFGAVRNRSRAWAVGSPEIEKRRTNNAFTENKIGASTGVRRVSLWRRTEYDQPHYSVSQH